MPTARPKILGAWLPRSQAPPSFPQYRGGLDTLTDLHGTPCHVWYGILPEPLGPVIFIHDVLATLSPYFLPSPFNRPMHKRSPFQYWSCYQVATSHWLGNFWTPLHLNYFNFVAHYTRFFLFVYHLFFNSLYVCTCLLYSVFLAEPAGINVWHSSLKKKGRLQNCRCTVWCVLHENGRASEFMILSIQLRQPPAGKRLYTSNVCHFCCIGSAKDAHCTNKLVVLTTEWLPRLQTSCGMRVLLWY